MTNLIERIEATGPCGDLDREIMFAMGYRFEERHIGAFYDDDSKALDWVFVDPSTDKWVSTHPHSFTSSIDDAMKLIEKGHGDILRAAIANLSKKFHLHICLWPKGENYATWFACFVAAEALRARGAS